MFCSSSVTHTSAPVTAPALTLSPNLSRPVVSFSGQVGSYSHLRQEIAHVNVGIGVSFEPIRTRPPVLPIRWRLRGQGASLLAVVVGTFCVLVFLVPARQQFMSAPALRFDMHGVKQPAKAEIVVAEIE